MALKILLTSCLLLFIGIAAARILDGELENNVVLVIGGTILVGLIGVITSGLYLIWS